MTIGTSLCGTESGAVFRLDNDYLPAEEFYEWEYQSAYPTEAAIRYDYPETMYVNTGYNKDGDILYLYTRTTPDNSITDNIIYALPHLTAVEVYATDADGTWAWVYYNGSAHDAAGNDTYMEGYAWCALRQNDYDYLTYTPNYWQ